MRQGAKATQTQAHLSILVRLDTKPFEWHGLKQYVGEQPGVTSLIDVQEPLPRHIMLKPNPPSVLSQADYEYLRHKGALSPLLMYSHQEILRAYFHHVHPMLPILHLSKLQDMETPDSIPPQGMLLYWSMAVVAVNVSPHGSHRGY
jgi:hypothetical protein